MKMSRYWEVHPLAAFLIILLGMVVYVSIFASIGDALHTPQAFGHFVAVWLPVLLSGIVFLSMCRNTSASKKSLYLGALATALIAPTIAWQLVLFVGFAFLGWQM
jgi:hypothetical protein